MLLAAYAGCGKSTAAQHLGDGVLDLPSMPYRWLLPKSGPCDGPEAEREKGALHHIADPRFPCNYVLDILKAERDGKTVLFPTIVPVIDLLAGRYGRDVLVVCPEPGLKEEYRQRFVARGNSESFLDLFTGGWEERLEAIEKSGGRHLRLKSGAYLLSVFPVLGDRPAAPVPEAGLAELARKVGELGRNRVLWTVTPRCQGIACPVEDLDAPAARERLEAIGRAACDRGLYPPDLFPEQAVRGLGGEYERVTWCENLDEFCRAVLAEPLYEEEAR